MDDYVAVCKLADLPDPSSQLVDIDGEMVVVIHAAGHVYAIDDVCTHDGGPLSDGTLITQPLGLRCPRHGAVFSAVTGEPLSMPATQPTRVHDVLVRDDQVLVRVRDN